MSAGSTKPNKMAKEFDGVFIVGETYADHIGEYRVISLNGSRVVYEYKDGVRKEGTTEIKVRIYKNLLPRADAGEDTAYPSYREITRFVAEVIRTYNKEHPKTFMPFELMKTALLEHPVAGPRIARIIDRSGKDPDGKAGVVIAFFSREWGDGKHDSFERDDSSNHFCYRVRKD